MDQLINGTYNIFSKYYLNRMELVAAKGTPTQWDFLSKFRLDAWWISNAFSSQNVLYYSWDVCVRIKWKSFEEFLIGDRYLMLSFPKLKCISISLSKSYWEFEFKFTFDRMLRRTIRWFICCRETRFDSARFAFLPFRICWVNGSKFSHFPRRNQSDWWLRV